MAVSPTDLAGSLAADVEGLNRLRAQAKTDPKGALKGAAQQFEAVFMNMLLKSMRDTTSQNTLFDSEQTKLYQSMLDQQLSQVLAKRGVGLAEVIQRQLQQQAVAPVPGDADGAAAPLQFTPPARFPAPAPAPTSGAGAAPTSGVGSEVRDFVDRTWPHALAAGRATGIPPQFIIGQAALESGWGKAELRAADGTPSHNLFGIKAGKSWTGPVAESLTTEYVNGVPIKSVERFRAYASYGEAFLDYAAMLRTQPRYAQVIENGRDAAGFARGLQQAGYATDPMYADKLLRIINGSALRAGLAA